MSSSEEEEFLYRERKKRKGTKARDEAIYGIFGEVDQEENEEEGGGGGSGSFGNRGFNLVRDMMSFQKQTRTDGPMPHKYFDSRNEASVTIDHKEGLSSIGGTKRSVTFSSRTKYEHHFADFERHTKGIGSKLLAKMGYKPGEGLGSKGSGISAPIEVKQRPKGAGLSYGGFEEAVEQLKKQQSHPQQRQQQQQEDSLFTLDEFEDWKKGGDRKKGKMKIKTIEEVVLQADIRKEKIIDMTGPQTRILTSITDLSESKRTMLTNTSHLPELRHNLTLLTDLAESRIQQVNRSMQHEKDKQFQLETARDSADDHLKQMDIALHRAQLLRTRIDEGLRLVEQSDTQDLDELLGLFERLKCEFHEEYGRFHVTSLALAYAVPALKICLANWQVLEQPRLYLETFRKWSNVLEGQEEPLRRPKTGERLMLPFESLMYTVWLPRVRAVLNNDWVAHDYDGAVQLIDAWMDLLPAFIVETLVDQVILPKLHRAVDSWNTKSDSTFVHLWLHPWLPLLGDELQIFYAPIRHKLASYLNDWLPDNRYAYDMLAPWKDVFDSNDMEKLLRKRVLPKLRIALREFSIDPSRQTLEPFESVMLWKDLFAIDVFARIWEDEFFPKWLHTLYEWLTFSPNPDYMEIAQWFESWKTLFPSDLAELVTIQHNFRIALDMMDRHLQEGSTSLPDPITRKLDRLRLEADSSSLRGRHRISIPSREIDLEDRPTTILSTSTSSSSLKWTLKDLVEHAAASRNISFIPLVGKTHQGNPIYRFGRNHIYLDKDVIRLQDSQQKNVWLPLSLDQLVEMT
jgi:tuftelin-interacting protein 11